MVSSPGFHPGHRGSIPRTSLTKGMRTEPKLKNCPFCGKKAKFEEYDPDASSMFPTEEIRIKCCLVSISEEKYFYEQDGRKVRGLKPIIDGGCYYSKESKAKEKLAKKWNKRPLNRKEQDGNF